MAVDLRPELRDFGRFTELQMTSLDIDPAYPVLRARTAKFTAEERLWYLLLYAAYYSLGSAERVWQHLDGRVGMPSAEMLRLPTGIERRGLRGGAPMERHLTSLLAHLDTFGSWEAWLFGTISPEVTPRMRYMAVREMILPGVWGNGRWACYKIAELLDEVGGYPLEATDMGNKFSSGPRHGLRALFGKEYDDSAASIREADLMGEAIRFTLRDEFGLTLDIDQVETMLCNWHALVDGRYYSGHDIDEMQEGLLRQSVAGRDAMRPLWVARRVALPEWTLGELHGWHGIDKARKRAYRDKRVLLARSTPWRT